MLEIFYSRGEKSTARGQNPVIWDPLTDPRISFSTPCISCKVLFVLKYGSKGQKMKYSCRLKKTATPNLYCNFVILIIFLFIKIIFNYNIFLTNFQWINSQMSLNYFFCKNAFSKSALALILVWNSDSNSEKKSINNILWHFGGNPINDIFSLKTAKLVFNSWQFRSWQ